MSAQIEAAINVPWGQRMRQDLEVLLSWSEDELWLDTTDLDIDEAEDAEQYVITNYPVEEIVGIDVDLSGRRHTIFKTSA